MNPSSTPWLDRLLIAIFLLALVLPLAFFKADPEAAAAEKRTLAPPPSLPRSKADLLAFPKTFDAWFADHFGFRQAMIKTHSRLSFFVLRSSPSPKIILGKKNWLYYNGKAARDGDTIADFRGVPPLSFAALERWRWAFQDQHDWLTDRGLHHLIALIPAKEVVYPENMPGHISRLGPSTIEQIGTYLRAHTTIPVIDTTPALIRAREQVLTYHPSDTHWNAYGAFIGYREIMNAVADIYPACKPRREEEFKREEVDGTGGDLATMIHVGDQLQQHYVFMNPLFPRVAAIEKIGHGDLADLIATTGNTNLPRAAILRDSFTEAMLPYISEHFCSTHYQWSRTGFEASLLERVNPDIVIQIIADRAFRKSRRYPVMMHEESIARRFGQSENIITTNASGMRAVAGADITPDSGGWTIHRAGSPPQIEIDPPADGDRMVWIIQWTVVSEDTREVFASWDCTEPDTEGLTTRRAPPTTIQAGTNIIHHALIDPDITSPILVQWGRNSGSVRIINMEIRGIPR